MSRGLLLALGLVAAGARPRHASAGGSCWRRCPGPGEHLLVRPARAPSRRLAERGWQLRCPRIASRGTRTGARWGCALQVAAQAVGSRCRRVLAVRGPHQRSRAARAARRALLRDHLSGYARVDASPLNQRIMTGAAGLDGAACAACPAHRRSGGRSRGSRAACGAGGRRNRRDVCAAVAGIQCHRHHAPGRHFRHARDVLCSCWPWLPRAACGAACAARLAAATHGLCTAVTGCVLALLYALLSGFSVPAQRTVVMLARIPRGCASARGARRPCGVVWRGAGCGAALRPDGAARRRLLAVVCCSGRHRAAGGRAPARTPRRCAARWHLQWVVSIALLPVTMAIFGTFPAGGFLVNVLAIPVFSLLLVPPVLIATACCLLPGVGCCTGAGTCCCGWPAGWPRVLWPGLCWCADLPGVLWHAAAALELVSAGAAGCAAGAAAGCPSRADCGAGAARLGIPAARTAACRW